MRATLFAVLWLSPAVLLAQGVDALGPSGGASLPAGNSTQRITLNLDVPPESEDRFTVDTSSIQIAVALIEPNGQRVTATNAQTAGFAWFERDSEAPLGTTDGGRTTSIEFKRAGSAGTYAIELTALNLASPAGAFVQFIYDKRIYRLTMQSFPGASIVGPVALEGAERASTLNVTLDQDEEIAMFDILVTDSTARVTLTLPDGRTLREGFLPDPTVEWHTTNESDGIMMLPEKGTHNVVSFERAAKGRYQIHAATEAPSAQLTVAFIPLGRMLSQDAGKPSQPTPGVVRVQAWLASDNSREYFVGDSIGLLVGFSGDPVADTVRLEVRTEYQEELPRTGDKWQYGPPVVEPVEVTFQRNPDGRYAGIVTPKRAGIFRVGVHATGTTLSGRSFSEESFPVQVLVSRVIARFRSLTEQAVNVDVNGTLDRLDITSNLNVLVAGTYVIDLFVEGAGNEGMYADVERVLGTGDQTLVVSIRAADIRRNLKDGPWTIKWVRMYRSTGDGYGNSVADLELNGFRLQTAPYKIDQRIGGPPGRPFADRIPLSSAVESVPIFSRLAPPFMVRGSPHCLAKDRSQTWIDR